MYTVEVVEKESKSGNKYTCLLIHFPCGYIKTVYLEQAEQYLAYETR